VQLNKTLIAESLAAITASPSPLGPHSSPPMETVAVTEPPFCRGFLLPRSPSSLPIEVGESSRGGDFEEPAGSLGAVFDATVCLQAVRISFEGNVKGF
jgi:hypothetical protein